MGIRQHSLTLSNGKRKKKERRETRKKRIKMIGGKIDLGWQGRPESSVGLGVVPADLFNHS